MSVRAVTPHVTAISGHLQFHPAPCAGDCCNFDAFTDAMATGEDIHSSAEEIPAGRGLHRYRHLSPPRPT